MSDRPDEQASSPIMDLDMNLPEIGQASTDASEEKPPMRTLSLAKPTKHSISKTKLILLAAAGVGGGIVLYQQVTSPKLPDPAELAPGFSEGSKTPGTKKDETPQTITASCKLSADRILTCISPELGEPLDENLEYLPANQQPPAPKAATRIVLQTPDGKRYVEKGKDVWIFTEGIGVDFNKVIVVPKK